MPEEVGPRSKKQRVKSSGWNGFSTISLILSLLIILAFTNLLYFSNVDIHHSSYIPDLRKLKPEIYSHIDPAELYSTSAEWQHWLAEGFNNYAEALTTESNTQPQEDIEAAKGTDWALSKQGQHSEYAYTTLISGLDSTYKYRGFLYNAIIMKHALKTSGSTADFIAMVGLNNPAEDQITFKEDLDLLRSYGSIVFILPRFVDMSADKEKKLYSVQTNSVP